MDCFRYISERLSNALRHPVIIAYVFLAASEIQYIHNKFIDFIKQKNKEPKTQACYMRGLLNDWFDYYNRGIIVKTVYPNFDKYLLWKEHQNKPIILSNETPFLLQGEGRFLVSQVNFQVILPNGFTLNQNQLEYMQSIINENKLPSKQYEIIYG